MKGHKSRSDGLHPSSDDLQPPSDGFQPTSDGYLQRQKELFFHTQEDHVSVLVVHGISVSASGRALKDHPR